MKAIITWKREQAGEIIEAIERVVNNRSVVKFGEIVPLAGYSSLVPEWVDFKSYHGISADKEFKVIRDIDSLTLVAEGSKREWYEAFFARRHKPGGISIVSFFYKPFYATVTLSETIPPQIISLPFPAADPSPQLDELRRWADGSLLRQHGMSFFVLLEEEKVTVQFTWPVIMKLSSHLFSTIATKINTIPPGFSIHIVDGILFARKKSLSLEMMTPPRNDDEHKEMHEILNTFDSGKVGISAGSISFAAKGLAVHRLSPTWWRYVSPHDELTTSEKAVPWSMIKQLLDKGLTADEILHIIHDVYEV